MQRELFRKAALEKLSTPERLDLTVTVLNRKSWIYLLTLSFLMGTVLTWAIFGTVKTRVEAMGILLGGEVFQVVSHAPGSVKEVMVQPGDKVAKDQVIARLDQPRLAQELAESRASLAALERQHLQLTTYEQQGIALTDALVFKQKENIEQSIRTLEKNKAQLKEQETREFGLLEKGLITRPQVQQTTQRVEQIGLEIEALRAELTMLNKQTNNEKFSMSNLAEQSQQRIEAAKRLIEQLEEQYAYQTEVKAEFDCEVLERLIDVGDVVGIGMPLIKMTKVSETDDGMLSGVLFLQAKDGKKIVEGKEIMIAPSTVLPEEYGYMLGTITYVSEYPTSAKAMFRVLKNDQLITQILQMGPPIEVYVRFTPNPETFSNYQWTSGKGPSVEIQAGTPCTGKITIDEQKPIALVIPKLKKALSLY